MNKKDNDDLEKIDRDINSHRSLVKYLILLVALFYVAIATNQVPLSESLEQWGTFGDFFGGILNPIFALFAFYWLTYSVRLQIKELKETREELSKAALAQQESARHQEAIARLEGENIKIQKEIVESQKITLEVQQRQITIQNFENVLFELFRSKNDIVSNLKFSPKMLDNDLNIGVQEYNGKDALRAGIMHYKLNYAESYLNDFLDGVIIYWGGFYNICFQIMDFINSGFDQFDEDVLQGISDSKKNKYMYMFKSALSQYEYEALFFYGISMRGNIKHKLYFEKYCFFEFMEIDYKRYEHVINTLSKNAYTYSKDAYKGNAVWMVYFREIFSNRGNMSESDYQDILIKLEKVGYVKSSQIYMQEKKYQINGFIKEYEYNNIMTSYSSDVIKGSVSSIYTLNNQLIIAKKTIIDNLNAEIFKIENQPKEDVSKFSDNLLKSLESSLHKLKSMLEEEKKQILKLENDIHEVDQLFHDLHANQNLETVLILLKYKMDYKSYSELISYYI